MRFFYGWIIVAAAVVFEAFVLGGTFFSFTVWVSPWRAEFGGSLANIMVCITAFMIVEAMLAPLIGPFVDNSSIRLVVCIGATITATGVALVAGATEIWQIQVLWACVIAPGALMAGTFPAMVLAAKWFTARRGLAVGIVIAGSSGGGLLMSPLLTWLYLTYGWRIAHLILAASIVIVVLPVAWLLIRNSPEEAGVEAEPHSAVSAARSAPLKGRSWQLREILASRPYWVIVATFVPMVLVMYGLQHNLGPIATDRHIGPMQASFIVSMFAGCAAVGKILFGAASDRIDPKYLVWLGLSFLFVSILLLKNGSGVLALALAGALLGLTLGAYIPLQVAFATGHFGHKSVGKVLGAVAFFMPLASLGPVLGGYLRDATGSFMSAVNVFALLLLLPACIVTLMPRLPRVGADASIFGTPMQQA